MNAMRRAGFAIGLMVGTATLGLVGCGDSSSLPSALVTGEGVTVKALNLASDTIIGGVELPAGSVPGDGPHRAVLPLNGRVGYVAGDERQTHVLKISESAVVIDPDSPVRIPNDGEILATSKRNSWVLVRRPGSRAGTHILAANNPLDLTVEGSFVTLDAVFEQATLCDDGETVLVRQMDERQVRLFTLSTGGLLTDTGHSLSLAASPAWVACAPGARAGAVLVQPHSGSSVLTFTIDHAAGMVQVGSAAGMALASPDAGPVNNALAFAADGSGLFIRTSLIAGGSQRGWVERFSFNPTSAEIGTTPAFTVDAAMSFFQGREQIGVHPDGGRIYVPETLLGVSGGTLRAGRVRVLDDTSGARLETLDLADMETAVQVIITH